ncbi:MAG TPA: helix-turn-helix transcriptional regulator [Solirubrobacteraceae bacterium]|jgi:DNA-binding XRE family transcriptional regulator|nr:helix-turn-helix transcriptional regulator [Solirubrobacteraceae bacterium]
MSSWKAYDVERTRLLRKFADNVIRLRGQKDGGQKPKYSQEDLAHDSGLHRTEIGKLERAETEPGLLTVMRVADGLGVTPNDLVADLPVPKLRKPPPGTPRN